MAIPPPPQGFTLDAEIPKPPPGFMLDQKAPPSQPKATNDGIPMLSPDEMAQIGKTSELKMASPMMTGMTDIPIDRRLGMMKAVLTGKNDEEGAKEFLRLGGQKIRRTENDEIAIQFDNGEWGVLNPEGIDRYDIGRFGAEILKYVPAAMASGGSSLGMAIGSGLTSIVNEKLSPEFDAEQPAIEAALSVAPDAAIGLAKNKFTAAAADKFIKAGKASAIAFTALKKTEEKVANKILSWTSDVEAKGGIEFVSRQAQDSADEYIKAVKQYADTKAAPFFQEAEKIAGDQRFDVSDLIRSIDEDIKQQPGKGVGPIANRLKEAKKFLSGGSEKKVVFNPKTKLFEEKTVQLSPTFAQLKSAKQILDDISFEKISEGGIGPNTARMVKGINRSIREKLIKATETEAGNPSSSPYYQGLALSSAGHSAKKRLTEDLIGNIAFSKEVKVDDVASTVFSRSPVTAKRALVALESQKKGISDTLRMIEMKSRIQKAANMNMQDFLRVMFPKKKGGDALIQTMEPNQKRIMGKIEQLMKEYGDKRGNIDLRLIEGSNVGALGDSGLAISRPITNPINWYRSIEGRLSGTAKLNQMLALSEILTNPEIAKTKEMRKFMNLNLRNKEQFIEGMRIISLLTDEIAEGIPDDISQESTESIQPVQGGE